MVKEWTRAFYCFFQSVYEEIERGVKWKFGIVLVRRVKSACIKYFIITHRFLLLSYRVFIEIAILGAKRYLEGRSLD